MKADFANLKPEQLKEIKNLEEKLEVTLIAYDLFATEGHIHQGNHSNSIGSS